MRVHLISGTLYELEIEKCLCSVDGPNSWEEGGGGCRAWFSVATLGSCGILADCPVLPVCVPQQLAVLWGSVLAELLGSWKQYVASRTNEGWRLAGNVLWAGWVILAGCIQVLYYSLDTPAVTPGWSWIWCHLYFGCCETRFVLATWIKQLCCWSAHRSLLWCCSFSSCSVRLEQADRSFHCLSVRNTEAHDTSGKSCRCAGIWQQGERYSLQSVPALGKRCALLVFYYVHLSLSV